MIASNSKIQCYKSCRRLYELKYIYEVNPVRKAEPLERGSSYHEAVEQLLKGGEAMPTDPKVSAMVWAFQTYILPELQQHNVQYTEEWFNLPLGRKHWMVGRYDAESEDAVIEHKTTSSPVDGTYFSNLDNDEQILTYMWASGKRKILYTVCRVPTIRQKQNESDEEFEQRCKDWYLEDTDNKVAMQEIYRSDEDIEQFGKELRAVVNEMEKCKLFYRNPSYCNKWGRMCDYAPICRNYDPTQEYVGFVKKGDKYESTKA